MAQIPPLIVLRGNSASGKSSVARALREHVGYGLAWVEQDHLRRVLLRERDVPHGKNIELIELNVRYCLEAGYVTVLDGILYEPHYGAMLERLHAAYGGHWYFLDVPLDETLNRHRTKPLAAVVDEETLRGWYHGHDALNFVQERVIPTDWSLDRTVRQIVRDAGLHPEPQRETC